MGSLATGGGSSAVAASTHAACQRFRRTDPLVVGLSRRALAAKLGHPDTSAGIPEARWMRAMAFERLVHHDRFVSQLLTRAAGAVGIDRPVTVHRGNGNVQVEVTAAELVKAHQRAVTAGGATMLTALAVPFVGMEHEPAATPVKPDFAVVAPRTEGAKKTVVGSWLLMGDAKDYERVRSRIDDGRMLKGFLQVALGAESAASWSKLPQGMAVHRYGALAVPRNAFLQPEAVVECLDDHRREMRARVDERTALLAELGQVPLPEEEAASFVGHLEATFDPATCVSCALFSYCRTELRDRNGIEPLLIELGVPAEQRAPVLAAIEQPDAQGRAPFSLLAQVRATIDGLPRRTGQRRVDPCGLPGTVDVVLAKADAAALGLHGIGLRRLRADGAATAWDLQVFTDPQNPQTRLAAMAALGTQIAACLAEAEASGARTPVHVVAPDQVTLDVLVSIADSLAGVETSRLRWQRDLDMGRPALTYDGEPATVPLALTADQRLAVSFLLEQDRSRAMKLRTPLVDLRATLSTHLVAGGPLADAGRLDYLVTWGEANRRLDHRAVSDAVAASVHTPGARLANSRSDEIHQALRGPRSKRGLKGKPDLARYKALVTAELEFKAGIVERALAVLGDVPVSRLRGAHLAMEAWAQDVWQRRLALQASDLVRFGRTGWVWRNKQVPMLDDDKLCATQLGALGNLLAAKDLALDAGTRQVALATVVALDPIRLSVSSRRIAADTNVVALHIGDEPCVDGPAATLTIQAGSFKVGNLNIGLLIEDGMPGSLAWAPKVVPEVSVGDVLVIADSSWFESVLVNGHQLTIKRPQADASNAPTIKCTPSSWAHDPEAHKWCCRSHPVAEADTADWLAERRARGELNPEVWPPVADDDQFDTPATGSPTSTDVVGDDAPSPGLTIDDLD